MALKKCKECGHPVSSKADTCPNCGYSFKSKAGGCLVGTFKLVGGLIGAIAALFFVTSLMSNTSQPKLISAPPADPVAELESRCRTFSDALPAALERTEAYAKCVATSKVSLKAHGAIK